MVPLTVSPGDESVFPAILPSPVFILTEVRVEVVAIPGFPCVVFFAFFRFVGVLQPSTSDILSAALFRRFEGQLTR